MLGNHSDELTPWLPVLASRSGYHCAYFVLPCCFYDFGQRFSRNNPRMQGQYGTYLDYVRRIGETCGFAVDVDALRIPSTKRVCHIGCRRVYEPGMQACIDVRRDALVGDAKVAVNTRASRQLHVDMADRLDAVSRIARALIALDPAAAEAPVTGRWRRGGQLAIAEAMAILPDALRAALRDTDGGLQTLLKAAHGIFDGSRIAPRDGLLLRHCALTAPRRPSVRAGTVRLVDMAAPASPTTTTAAAAATTTTAGATSFRSSDAPTAVVARRSRGVARSAHAAPTERPRCWFYFNHPDGCPRGSNCARSHVDASIGEPAAA